MKPTAFQVATAIVAACRETGEDPVICADQQTASIRARHYVMWALMHVFQEMKPGEAAAACGVNGKPMTFYHNSRYQMIPGKRPGGGGFWVPEAYARVIAAIEKTVVAAPPTSIHRTPRAEREPSTAAATPTPPIPAEPPPLKMGPLPPVKPIPKHTKWSGTMDRGGLRPTPGTIERVLKDDEDDAVFDRGTVSATVNRRSAPTPRGKREMEDDLRRAVQNTAAQTPPPEK